MCEKCGSRMFSLTLGLWVYDMCDDKWMLIRHIVIKSENVEKLERPVVISTEMNLLHVAFYWTPATYSKV